MTHAQLVAIGVGRRTVDRWLALGRLRAVHRNVYAFGPRPLSRHGKWLAGVLALGTGAVLSHRSAAALWELTADRPIVDVTAPRGRQSRPGRPGIQLHRCQLDRAEVTRHGGIPVTTVARTLSTSPKPKRPTD